MSTQPIEPSSLKLWTLKEVAEATSLSESTLRSMIASGKLQAREIGSGKKRKTFRIPHREVMKLANLGS